MYISSSLNYFYCKSIQSDLGSSFFTQNSKFAVFWGVPTDSCLQGITFYKLNVSNKAKFWAVSIT